MSTGVKVKDAAEQLGHKFTSRIYSLIQKGRLDTIKDSEGAVLVSQDSLDAYKLSKGERKAKSDKPKKAKAVKEKGVRPQPKPSKKKAKAVAA